MIDSLAPGEGTSGHANGQVMAELTLSPDRIVQLYDHDPGEAVIRFSARAPDLVFELIQRHGIACEARRSGTSRKPGYSLRWDSPGAASPWARRWGEPWRAGFAARPRRPSAFL